MPVNVIGTLKPKNNGKFPVAEAVDIKVTDNLRLDEALENKAELSSVNFALAGKANATDFATSTANLQGQIDQIVISSSAESVVAPEVAAARVGADGTTYSTLKDRLDSENLEIKDSLDTLLESNFYIYDTENILSDELYEGTQGIAKHETLYAFKNYTVSTLIPLFDSITLESGSYTIFLWTEDTLPKPLYFGVQAESPAILNQICHINAENKKVIKNFTLNSDVTATKIGFFAYPSENTFTFTGRVNAVLVKGTYTSFSKIDDLRSQVENIEPIVDEIEIGYTQNLFKDELFNGTSGISKNKNDFILSNYSFSTSITPLFDNFILPQGDYTLFISVNSPLPKRLRFGVQTFSLEVNQNIILPQGDTFAYKNFTVDSESTITKAGFFVWPAEDEFTYTGRISVMLVSGTYTSLSMIESLSDSVKALENRQPFGRCLVWEDDFDLDEVDTSKWGYELGYVRNQELQFYRAENATVEHSNLVLTAKRESYQGHNWTSACVTGQFKKYFKYGRIEAKIKLPDVQQGAFPAFWMMAQPYRVRYTENPDGSVTKQYAGEDHWYSTGEVDIFERFGTQRLCCGIWSPGGTSETMIKYKEFWADESLDTTAYHVYALEWDYDEMKFFVDDTLLGTAKLSEAHLPVYRDNAFYIIFDLAVGAAGGMPAEETTEMKMYIDWVRVYSL